MEEYSVMLGFDKDCGDVSAMQRQFGLQQFIPATNGLNQLEFLATVNLDI
ncbi:hypothetical protein CCACVL1_29113 [Corchorus capsularis]|uniref:Uncharacterized protein n=1 Tax=Corchorus capsularis TaxID=210143 RepID=A0A1R3G3N4_COCAP|nr:hypothetical protein CCACVL1_29113 [Corchorus capsularis]